MLAHAVEVIDPFHVVHLAAGRLTMVRCRLQREGTGRRGVKGERLYDCRRALLKTASLRTPRQRERVDTLLADPINDALRLAQAAAPTSWPTSRTDTRPTDPPKPSTAASRPCAASP